MAVVHQSTVFIRTYMSGLPQLAGVHLDMLMHVRPLTDQGQAVADEVVKQGVRNICHALNTCSAHAALLYMFVRQDTVYLVFDTSQLCRQQSFGCSPCGNQWGNCSCSS